MRRVILSLGGILLFFPPSLFAVRDLGTLGGSYSFARDINNVGSVAGEATDANGDTRAFLWTAGVMQNLGSYTKDRFSMANGLNDKNQVVGYSRASAKVGLTKAILWEKGDVLHLKPLRLSEYSQASEINENEEIVGVNGTQAIVWRKRKAKALPGLGGDFSIALGINNKGQIVGNCQTSTSAVHACRWVSDNVQDLGTLGGRFSTANAINDAGQIVGSSETASGDIHAFLWENGRMQDLGPGMIRNLNALSVFVGEGPVGDKTQAQIWEKASLRSVDNLPGMLYSSIFSINNTGFSVGVSEIRTEGMDHSAFHATLWD